MTEPPQDAIRRCREGIAFAVRLTPKGGRAALEGWWMGSDGVYVKARVAAAAAEGEANRALIRLLAGVLQVANSKVHIMSGQTSRLKRIVAEGDSAVLEKRLRDAMGERR